MSLFNTIKTGASGLGASGSSLAVIGDNIANLNTRGFKKGRIAFADVMPQYIGGINGPTQVGRGTGTSNVTTLHQQGGFQSSGSALDLAIGGNGFFQVETETGDTFFTRDGSFMVDKDDVLTTQSGLQLMGYPAVDGTISGQAGPLTVDTSPLPAKATEAISFNMVLDSGADATATTTLPSPIEDITSDFSTSVTVYDSLGQAHEMTVHFDRVGANDWDYYAVVDGAELDPPATDALVVDAGTLTFDTEGTLTGITPGTGTAATWAGADPWTPTLDFGLNVGDSGKITMNGAESATTSIQQDGYKTAYMVGIGVEPDGTVVGQYDNREDRILGQVAIAQFTATEGLERVGGNMYRATAQSGDATLGIAGTGGRGDISGYALESSNVDLEDEFVSMIQSQRAYQANASTIRASDEGLQTLIQLV